ncbi:chitin synthase III catalytic subunit, partial [Phakopsora pachyrhizi]
EALSDSGIGINPRCTIPRMGSVGGQDGSLGNIANIITCCISFLVSIYLLIRASRRRAAVGRVEVMIFFMVYGLISIFQLLDTGSILKQGTRSIVWLTSIHHSLIVDLFGLLVWIGFLQFQLLEDGSSLSLTIVTIWNLICLVPFDYIFLDTAFGITTYFLSKPASHLYSPWTFSMVFLFPIISVFLYSIFTITVSIKTLREFKPILILLLSLTSLLIGTVLFRYILTVRICESSRAKVDGSFLGSLFETFSLMLFYLLWINLTEEDWEDDDEDELEEEDFRREDQQLYRNQSDNFK